MFRSKSLLFPLFLFSLFAFASHSAFSQCTAPAGNVHWWMADGHPLDVVGGEHALLVNGATFGPGRIAQGFRFDGVNDFAGVPNNPLAPYNFDGSFSIDAWIFLESAPPEFAPIVSKWNDLGVNRRSYFLAVENNSGLRLRWDVSETGFFLGGNSSAIRSGNIIQLNTWTHVAAVFDASVPTLRFYVNGFQVPAAAAEISPTVNEPFTTTEPLLFGAANSGGNSADFFDGGIDEIRLYDRALTNLDVLLAYAPGAVGRLFRAC